MESKLKINIIGRGNVGSHLFKAFGEHAKVISVDPHTLDNLWAESDFTIIAVADNAILNIIEKIKDFQGIVAHTSGSTGVDIFLKANRQKRFGVLYPLQTFSKNTFLDYSEIPFLIEASDPKTEENLRNLASLISENVRHAGSNLRASLHIAAVLACNFTNHLWSLSEAFLKSKNIEFSILLPLIKETVSKLSRLRPSEAQTGPAVRKDYEIIDLHKKELENYPEICEIYTLLSNSILSKTL